MEFKGTKGKWNVMSAGGLGVPYIVYTGDETIFQCYNTHSNNDAKYNAQLISKSPEMFDMIEELIYQFENNNNSSQETDLLNEAKQLIKEATEL